MARIDRIDLSDSVTLADLLSRLAEKGVTDYTKVTVRMEYGGGCCGGHAEGEYCYCEPGYEDPRLEWPI